MSQKVMQAKLTKLNLMFKQNTYSRPIELH
jgi:hypothetical protein